jgi:hypothetical protein
VKKGWIWSKYFIHMYENGIMKPINYFKRVKGNKKE